MSTTVAIIHPIAILNALGEFLNLNKPSFERNLNGCFIGFSKKHRISCLSSFQIPFDSMNENYIWFIDHNYIEKMSYLWKKINFREKIVGLYSFRSGLKDFDLELLKYFFVYTKEPIICLFSIEKQSYSIKVKAFSPQSSYGAYVRTFKPIPVKMGMLRSEDVGINFILQNSIWKKKFHTKKLIDRVLKKFKFPLQTLQREGMKFKNDDFLFLQNNFLNYGNEKNGLFEKYIYSRDFLERTESKIYPIVLVRIILKLEKLTQHP